MNLLVIGDVVGKPGVDMVKKSLPSLIKKYDAQMVIVNGENSADGMGITKNILNDLFNAGASIISMGNHTWGKKDIFSIIDEEKNLIRPANYAEGLPGHGSTIIEVGGIKVGVIDLIGRVNMGTFDSPFEIALNELKKMDLEGVQIKIVEIHAEATAEKIALAYYLKDIASLVYGTHTHVQTADEKIYDTGMGYITDVGMTGPKNSIIGMDTTVALKRFLTQIPERYMCAQGEMMLNGIIVQFDDNTFKVSKIERISI